MKSNRAVVAMIPAAAEPDLAPLVRAMLDQLAEDPHRAGLAATPVRVDRALKFLTSGYRVDIRRMLNGALFEVKCDEMVVIRDIEFFSLCEHYMLPFFGKI